MDAVAPIDLRFNGYKVRLQERQLLIDGAPARLDARAIDVLAALIERREGMVSKNEPLDLVWPGVVVEEDNLLVHVIALRRLLGPQIIATTPGRGYRFTAMLQGEPAHPAQAAPAHGSAPAAPRAPTNRWAARWRSAPRPVMTSAKSTSSVPTTPCAKVCKPHCRPTNWRA